MKLPRFLAGLLVAALLLSTADARNPRGTPLVGGTGILNYVGANLDLPDYFSASYPCLNVLNCVGQNGVSGWTSSPSESGNGQDGLLALDANGYPTSLTPTGTSGVTAGAAYTTINTFAFTNTPALAPGQTIRYPIGSYTLSCSGADYSITMSGDSASSGSGLSLTCSHTTPASLVFQVTSPSSNGIKLAITSIGTVIPGSIRLSLVQSAYLAQYQAGELFHPLFKAMLTASGYSNLRFMEWSNVWNCNKKITFTADLPVGSVGGNLHASPYPNGWDQPTGTYTVNFINGDVRQMNAVWHSAAVSWTPATTSDNPFSASFLAQGSTPLIASWAQRPTATTMTWSTPKGVPVEVQWQLAKELNADWWINTFLASGTAGMSDFGTNGANYYDTQMATLVQSLTAGTAWLAAGHKIYIEDQNEVWNGSNGTNDFANKMGFNLLNHATCASNSNNHCGQQFLGVMTAQVSDAWKAVWGTTPFNNTIVMVMGTQNAGAQGASFLEDSMNAPDWVSLGGGNTAPYTHGIKAYAVAPYFGFVPGISNRSSAGQPVAITFTGTPSGTAGTATAAITCSAYPCTFLVTFSDNEVRSVTIASSTASLTWTGAISGAPTTAAVYGDVAAILANADPLSTLFGLMYSNVTGGVTYPGVSATGFISPALANIPGAAQLSGQSWFAGLQLEFYEIGSSFVPNSTLSGAYQTSFITLITSMARDARMAYVLHDPFHQLSSNPGYLDSLRTFSSHVGNWHYGDTYPPGAFGEWGIYESALQPIAAGSAAPAKAQAMSAFTH